MFLDGLRSIRGWEAQRKIILVAMLLSGGAPFTGCLWVTPNSFSATCPSNTCDPPVGVHDPNFRAGATVSWRTPAAGSNDVTLFARTGVLPPLDGSSSAAFVDNTFVTASGTATKREYVTVPLYGGVTVPAKNIGVPIPNLAFEAFGGAHIKNEKIAFSLVEAGGDVASASKTYWTVDPAVGAGIRYDLGTFYGVPTSLGAALIADFQLRDHSITAPSPSISGLSYTFTNPAHPSGTAVFSLNFDLPPK